MFKPFCKNFRANVFFSLACVFSLCFSLISEAQTSKLALKRITESVYVVEDDYYIKENSLIYIGPEFVTLIGATWSPDTAKILADEVKKITDKPISEVINTNYHPDRAGGNAYWQQSGAKIIATQLTAQWMRSDWQTIVDFTRRGIPAYPQLPLVMPTVVYPGDFELQHGRIKAFYLGPSHTEDGIFVYLPEEKILYGNCILKEQLGNLSSANLDEYPKTLLKLKQLNLEINTIVAGHASSLHGPELIEHYLRLLEKNAQAAR